MTINVLDYLKKTFKNSPDEPAIIEGEKVVTFSELQKSIAYISTMLKAVIGDTRKQPVAVFMPKCAECVFADIAIITTGNAYMNLDEKTPDTRISAILTLIDPATIITTPAYYERVCKLFAPEKVINLEKINYESESLSTLYPAWVIDTDPLCIINTSGSTGTPKGVVLNHRSFIDFIEWSLDTMPYYEHEVMGCLSPVIFDIYCYELCLMMAKGATMVLIPEEYAAFPVKILQLLQKRHVSYIFWVPTIMTNIANMGLLERIPLPDLHIVWFAGEVFQTKQYNIWHRMLPQTMFVNMYGPIEITLDCTHYIISRELSDDEPIPIGYAMRNTDIFTLDDEDRLCSQGEEGELCVRGTSLAMGYYNNPEKTAAAFVQNPLNTAYPEIIYRTGDIVCVNEHGEIMFRGRKDTLVKHSGYRIELTEIEHVIINTLNIVKNGCILYDHDKKEIVLFYEADSELSVSEMRKRIGSVLPRYMIPAKYHKMEQIPRNPNGKIDRLKLKESLIR